MKSPEKKDLAAYPCQGHSMDMFIENRYGVDLEDSIEMFYLLRIVKFVKKMEEFNFP